MAQTPRDFAIDLAATVSTNTPCVSLSWTLRRPGNITSQAIYRRLKGQTSWTEIGSLTTNQTSYVDSAALPYTEYEYWMRRDYSGISPSPALGYISAGVALPMVENRGKLLLVVDSTMATPLAQEIAQLQADLASDGWTVQTLTATRTDTAANVKAQIKAAYTADPANLKMVYLLGHVPVPYSGDIAPDGHGNHYGAWPADGYYGDMDGTWTDTTVNDTSASDTRNRNTPGDGKFDQNYFPGLIELMVGRVDLSNMTRAPCSAASETTLLRRYLRKAHDFRFKLGAYAAIPRRSIIRDGFGNTYSEGMAMAGWAWVFTGVGSLIDEPPSGQWFSTSYAGSKSYLVGYGNGGGSWDTASTVGNSVDFGLGASRVVFTSLFGSYFGDWDSGNNFMRAPLAGSATGDSLGLCCFWSARPHWYTHSLGMGETLGYCAKVTQNSSLAGGGGYTPGGYSASGVHVGLMGDPALRLHAVEPPRNVTASSANTQVALAWSASAETNLVGYHVYRATTNAGPFTRLTSAPLAATTYTDTSVSAGQSYCYLVRTLKLDAVPGGTYYNLSVGSLVTLTASAGATAAPRNPTSLTATQTSAANALLAWADNSGDETGFRIERKTNGGGTYAALGTVGANVTNFTDTGTFANGSTYYYRVVATGAGGDSPPSDEASFEAVAGYFTLPLTRTKVSKTAGSAAIAVNRFGGATGPVSVNFATANSSAVAGTHYTATNGTLTWADGDTTPKTITVPIINTASPQSGRQFKVNLSSASSGTGYSVNSSIAVLIEDPTATLAAPWSQTIIGGITDSSAAVLTDGTFGSVTIGGAGAASTATTEAGRFIYQARDGDGIMTAYFPAGIPSDGNARIALMVRASTANNAIMATAVASANTGFGAKFVYRATAGGSASALPAAANTIVQPCWMRLTRAGYTFSADVSTDSTNWTSLGSATLSALPTSAQWGIFHYSSDWSVTGLGNYHLATAQNIVFDRLPLPGTPTGLVATATAPTVASLAWGSVSNAAAYRVERSAETGSFTQIADLVPGSGTTQTLTDTNVTADTVYRYRVSAYNGTGASAPCDPVYLVTPQPDIGAVLTTDDAAAADAAVRRDLPDTPLGTQTNLSCAGYSPTYTLLPNATKSYLRFNLAGQAATYTTAQLKLTFLGTNFTSGSYFYLYAAQLDDASDGWSESAITWNNAPQNDTAGCGFTGDYYDFGSYFQFGFPAAGQAYTLDLDVDPINNSRGTNNLITIGLYTYWGAGTMWASREHPAYAAPTLTLSAPSPLPLRASCFTAAPGSGWSVRLQWRDNAATETGYEIERSAGGGEFVLLQALASNATNFLDTATQPETSYTYRVRAVNAAGPSSWTPVAAIRTPDFFHAGGTLWDGGGANALVSTPDNWDLNALPAFDGTAYFNFASGGTTASINTNVAFLGLNFNSDSDFTIAGGAGTLTLGSGGLRALAPTTTPRTYTLAANIALAANQTWGVTNNGAGLTTVVVSGPVSDGASAFGLTKMGNGTLVLAGDNSYDGPTLVPSNTVLRAAHDNALGSTNGATTVSNGGALEVSGGVTVPEPLTISGDAATGYAGALRSTGGTNTWSGPLTQVAPAARIRAKNGSSLTLAGGLTGTGITLAPDTGSVLAVSAPVKAGSSTLYAQGGGTLALAATGSAWGTLEVAGCTLRTDVANALPASSILLVGGASGPADGAVDLNGNSQTVAQLKRGTTGAGNRLVTSAVPATLTVNQTSGSYTYDGQLSGALSLVKTGAGTLTLSGTNNTFSGGTTVSNGTLVVSTGASLGNSRAVTVAGGTLNIQNSAVIPDDAVLRIANGGAKANLVSGVNETVGVLVLGNDRKAKGTWGSSTSSATNIDSTHFSGSGMLTVVGDASNQWDGGGANDNLNTAQNWEFDGVPPFDLATPLFFGIGGGSATVNTNASLAGLIFSRSADFTLAAGGGVLTLGGGGIQAIASNAVPQIYTVGADLLLASDQTWSVTNTGTLVVSGSVSDGASTFGITKAGNGILTLSGNNSYDGPTLVPTGSVLRVAHDNALGSTNGATTVSNGGALEVSGGVTVPEPLTISGDAAIGYAGALRSTGGTNTWSGPLTQVAPAARIRAKNGSSLTLAGGLTGTGLTLAPDTGSVLAVSAPVKAGSSTLYAQGGGTLALAATGSAWGTLEVAGCTLRTDVENALPASSILLVGGASGPADGAVDLNGNGQTVAQLKRGTTGAGNRLVTSAAPATLTVNQTSGSYTYDGQLSGALSLVKTGAGTLTLSGTNNTFSGGTTVSNGTLVVSTGASLGNSRAVTVAGGTLNIQNSAVIPDDAALRIASGGAKVNLVSGVNDTVGTLQLDGARKRRGTWGSPTSSATYIDSTHFSGSGVLTVTRGPETVFLVQ